MVATSWAARLKAGLARTRDVLNTPVSELFVAPHASTRRSTRSSRRALLQADCGVSATQWLLDSLRAKARKQKHRGRRARSRARCKDALTELLTPLERTLDTSRAPSPS